MRKSILAVLTAVAVVSSLAPTASANFCDTFWGRRICNGK